MTKKDNENILTDYNIYLFHEGKNYNSYNFLGSHFTKEKGRLGVRFTVWAPNAKEIRVVGEFNNWDGSDDKYCLTKVSSQGIWSVFIKGIKEEIIYKYEILNSENKKVLKSDPCARFSELRPNTASKLVKERKFRWSDKKWLQKRTFTNVYETPMNTYEIHLGSWKRNENGEFLNYREMGKHLAEYVCEMGYTHVELMPIMEHPLDDSWGYQVTGYYAPTSRYGNIEDFKYMINVLHRQGIGVILDWVPGHFCKDEHGLYRFDGTPTYEYSDRNKSENVGWGAANFDVGKPEVKSFLISNAIFWLKEFHVDGFRVDAVANMLYLNYGRNEGEWLPNKYGGNENLEAIEFFKELNQIIFEKFPNIYMIAEESTTWPMITKPVHCGGLGFNFKWNMGWMNDTLKYIEIDPIYRKDHQSLLNFSMMYNYSENFILPISHDEVVHGKKSLIDKMWGDYWNKFAGLRVFMVYMMMHPGKKTLFMGNEFAQFIEWRSHESLEWKLIDEFEMHKKTHNFFKNLNSLYINNSVFWKYDYKGEGFEWIDADNSKQSILVFMRKNELPEETIVIVCNFTPVVYYDYKIGVPYEGEYNELLNTDSTEFGGSGQVMKEVLYSKNGKWQNQPYYLSIKVPPMAAVILKINRLYKKNEKKNCGGDKMKVLFVAAEADPFIKTGGLGDVAYALPKHLVKLGLEVRVVIPKYKNIKKDFKDKLKFQKSVTVPVGWRNQYCGIFECEVDKVKYYVLDNEYYFLRDEIYGNYDDGEKFAFFDRAVLMMLKEVEWKPDIIHCNDWQTGMIPVLYKCQYIQDSFYSDIKIVFSIHNLLFQGNFDKKIVSELFSLNYEIYENGSIEFYGAASFMKGALNYCDKISTVSKSYSNEIQMPFYGERMDGIIRSRSNDLCGIVNGIDYSIYDPKTDKYLYKQYDKDSFENKLINKLMLQRELGLKQDKYIPMIGIVSRLTKQKGIDIIAYLGEKLVKKNMQLVVLGTGDKKYENYFRKLQENNKEKVSANMYFDDKLAHKIYGASDMFLMPSLFEPCGLGQLIALRYGSIPIVRETGGLRDTVKAYNKFMDEGNGFSFTNYNGEELLYAIEMALEYYKDKKIWKSIVLQAMNSDNSWEKSAQIYKELYYSL